MKKTLLGLVILGGIAGAVAYKLTKDGKKCPCCKGGKLFYQEGACECGEDCQCGEDCTCEECKGKKHECIEDCECNKTETDN